MDEGREAHPSASDEPTREDAEMPERIITLPVAKVGGNPLKVLIRKLDPPEVVMARGEPPAEVKVALGVARERKVTLTVKQRADIAADYQKTCEALILAAALEPRFYRGRKKPDPRPVDEEGRTLAVAPLSALYDEDRELLYGEILRLSEGFDTEGGAAAQRLANFPPEHEEGITDGAGGDAAVPVGVTPAPEAGVRREGAGDPNLIPGGDVP